MPCNGPRRVMTLIFRQHVPNLAKVPAMNMLLDLLLGQPLEVLQPKDVAFQVRLAGQDAAFEEEDLLPGLGDARVGLDEGLSDEVADGNVPDDPRVHVNAGALDEDAFCGL